MTPVLGPRREVLDILWSLGSLVGSFGQIQTNNCVLNAVKHTCILQPCSPPADSTKEGGLPVISCCVAPCYLVKQLV